MKFDLPKEQFSIIKVIGVGGGGSNAVNHMYRQGIKDVDFMVCNTDQQALDISPVPVKVQLGSSLTSGLGAGSKSSVGENAAIESIDEIKGLLGETTKMIFITAGMGGGTGTGAAPVIAQAAREMGVLTVGIVTMPFSFEGKKRRRRADEGIKNMRDNVDTLLVINNDKLREMFGNLTLDNAFEEADSVLTTAAKGIAEAITNTGKINVDFNDVKTVMTNSGVAVMGSARATGEDRAQVAVEHALNSPLLSENDIKGAAHVLLNITYGKGEILMDEITEITDFIEDEAGMEAEVIWGHGLDERLEDHEINITIIATGFTHASGETQIIQEEPRTRINRLDDDIKTELTRPIPSQPQRPQATQASIFDASSSQQQTPAPEKNETENLEPVLKSGPAIQKTIEPEDRTIETPSEPKDIIRHQLEDEVPAPTTPESFTSFTQEEPQEDIAETKSYSLEPELKSPDQELAGDKPERIEIEIKKEEPVVAEQPPAPAPAPKEEESNLSPEERHKVAQERMARLRNLSMQLKTPSGIASLESEPAFKRRSVELDDVSHSSESQVSRFTLSESEDEEGKKKTELRSNNSFLHDNVD
ncbi:cell division protein FtsZ [bacterium SCSIO 12741]|nr:cell division protein FtsZ [bacterium SCSIO 12741]